MKFDRPIIALCGTGGTGKTTVLNALTDRLRSEGYPFEVFTSVSREFFRMQGFTKEADYKVLPLAEKAKFQYGMMKFYMQRLQTFIDANPGKKILCDRSIFDHFAYWAQSGACDLATYDAIMYNQAHFYCRYVDKLFWFPYPAPFQGSVNVDDGFRDIDVGYNLGHSAMVYMFAKKALTDSGHDAERLHIIHDGDLDRRVEFILNLLPAPESQQHFNIYSV
jgi:predicted ATPase